MYVSHKCLIVGCHIVESGTKWGQNVAIAFNFSHQGHK